MLLKGILHTANFTLVFMGWQKCHHVHFREEYFQIFKAKPEINTAFSTLHSSQMKQLSIRGSCLTIHIHAFPTVSHFFVFCCDRTHLAANTARSFFFFFTKDEGHFSLGVRFWNLGQYCRNLGKNSSLIISTFTPAAHKLEMICVTLNTLFSLGGGLITFEFFSSSQGRR